VFEFEFKRYRVVVMLDTALTTPSGFACHPSIEGIFLRMSDW
jgi:hypothetical protein